MADKKEYIERGEAQRVLETRMTEIAAMSGGDSDHIVIKSYLLGKKHAKDFINKIHAADVVEVEKVAEMLRIMFDDDSACNYNRNDEWLPLVCEFSDECPMPKERLGCWKQFVKHFLAKMDGERKDKP